MFKNQFLSNIHSQPLLKTDSLEKELKYFMPGDAAGGDQMRHSSNFELLIYVFNLYKEINLLRSQY